MRNRTYSSEVPRAAFGLRRLPVNSVATLSLTGQASPTAASNPGGRLSAEADRLRPPAIVHLGTVDESPNASTRPGQLQLATLTSQFAICLFGSRTGIPCCCARSQTRRPLSSTTPGGASACPTCTLFCSGTANRLHRWTTGHFAGNSSSVRSTPISPDSIADWSSSTIGQRWICLSTRWNGLPRLPAPDSVATHSRLESVGRLTLVPGVFEKSKNPESDTEANEQRCNNQHDIHEFDVTTDIGIDIEQTSEQA